jgi:hypothetical protein
MRGRQWEGRVSAGRIVVRCLPPNTTLPPLPILLLLSSPPALPTFLCSPRSYYLPTGADRLILAFRRWLEGPGGHGPWGAPPERLPDYSPLIADRRALLDRRSTHTQHCAACRTADAWMVRIGRALLAAAATPFSFAS